MKWWILTGNILVLIILLSVPTAADTLYKSCAQQCGVDEYCELQEVPQEYEQELFTQSCQPIGLPPCDGAPSATGTKDGYSVQLDWNDFCVGGSVTAYAWSIERYIDSGSMYQQATNIQGNSYTTFWPGGSTHVQYRIVPYPLDTQGKRARTKNILIDQSPSSANTEIYTSLGGNWNKDVTHPAGITASLLRQMIRNQINSETSWPMTVQESGDSIYGLAKQPGYQTGSFGGEGSTYPSFIESFSGGVDPAEHYAVINLCADGYYWNEEQQACVQPTCSGDRTFDVQTGQCECNQEGFEWDGTDCIQPEADYEFTCLGPTSATEGDTVTFQFQRTQGSGGQMCEVQTNGNSVANTQTSCDQNMITYRQSKTSDVSSVNMNVQSLL